MWQEPAAPRDFNPAYVGSGSFVTGPNWRRVRPCPLCPESDVSATKMRFGRDGPNADKVHRSRIYSITSSALANSVPGIVTPIALDVFRSMTNGCSGISDEPPGMN
jgi:hypothetical protein